MPGHKFTLPSRTKISQGEKAKIEMPERGLPAGQRKNAYAKAARLERKWKAKERQKMLVVQGRSMLGDTHTTWLMRHITARGARTYGATHNQAEATHFTSRIDAEEARDAASRLMRAVDWTVVEDAANDKA